MPKYLQFLTILTELQSQLSNVLQLDLWIFILCMGGKVCSDNEWSKMVDLLKFRNKLLSLNQLWIDLRSTSMFWDTSFQELPIQINTVSST